jgi:hypothetical protein
MSHKEDSPERRSRLPGAPGLALETVDSPLSIRRVSAHLLEGGPIPLDVFSYFNRSPTMTTSALIRNPDF